MRVCLLVVGGVRVCAWCGLRAGMCVCVRLRWWWWWCAVCGVWCACVSCVRARVVARVRARGLRGCVCVCGRLGACVCVVRAACVHVRVCLRALCWWWVWCVCCVCVRFIHACVHGCVGRERVVRVRLWVVGAVRVCAWRGLCACMCACVCVCVGGGGWGVWCACVCV